MLIAQNIAAYFAALRKERVPYLLAVGIAYDAARMVHRGDMILEFVPPGTVEAPTDLGRAA